MPNSTTEDYVTLGLHLAAYQAGRVARLLALFEMSDQYGMTGFPVSRFEHGLQTATLAHRAGKDEEYVVCALLHDAGECIVFDNHAEIGAETLRPFISDESAKNVLSSVQDARLRHRRLSQTDRGLSVRGPT